MSDLLEGQGLRKHEHVPSTSYGPQQVSDVLQRPDAGEISSNVSAGLGLELLELCRGSSWFQALLSLAAPVRDCCLCTDIAGCDVIRLQFQT